MIATQTRGKGERLGVYVAALFFYIVAQAEARMEFLTYYGGTQLDQLHDTQIDDSNNVYIAGTTGSLTNFPMTNAFQGSFGGLRDGFFVKFSFENNAPVFSSYFGGSQTDTVYGIDIDAEGNTYLVGFTESADLPVTADAMQPVYGGEGDGFMAKFDSTGSNLLYCSYLGGTNHDDALDIVVSEDNDFIFLVGGTSGDFPFISSAAQSSYGGGGDLILMGLSLDLTNIVFSTYWGGSGEENSPSIYERNGLIAVGLFTASSDYPLLYPYQSAFGGGGTDAALTFFDETGASLFSTYYGGDSDDTGRTPVIDSDGDVYLIGWTSSTNLPGVQVSSFQSALSGGEDGFLARFVQEDSTNWGVASATYLGGTANDRCIGSAMDRFDDIHIMGTTSSSNFPIQSAFQSAAASTNSEGFFMRFYPKMRVLSYSSYVGGTRVDDGRKVVCDADGNAYLSGWVQSTTAQQFPATNAWDATLSGSRDCFIGVYHNVFITNYSFSASNMIGHFNAHSGRTYTVQSCSNLVEGVWTDVTNVTSMASGTNFVLDINATTDKLFRISF